MFRSTRIISLLITAFMATTGVAQTSGPSVEAIEICTNIIEREPVDTDSVFAPTVERLYCFTKIANATAPTTISHIWYFNDKEMAKVELSVKDTAWRTWSSKRIVMSWTGNWRVDVVTADGTVLKSKPFSVQ